MFSTLEIRACFYQETFGTGLARAGRLPAKEFLEAILDGGPRLHCNRCGLPQEQGRAFHAQLHTEEQ